jgi:hypothetical protein
MNECLIIEEKNSAKNEFARKEHERETFIGFVIIKHYYLQLNVP